MKKKHWILSALCAISLAGFGQVNEAAETNASTKGIIEFTQNDGSEEGGTTTDPGEGGNETGGGGEVDPGEGGGSTTGALRLRYVPPITFGQNKLSTKAQNYYADFQDVTPVGQSATEKRPTYFEVVDLRGGTKGWQVAVKNNGVFTTNEATPKTFKGVLTFKDLTVQSNSGITTQTQFPTVPSTAVVSTDAAQAVSLAEAKSAQTQGYGSWSVRVGEVAKKTSGQGEDGTGTTGQVDASKKDRNPAVQLAVPTGQIVDTAKSYSTTLEWILTDAF